MPNQAQNGTFIGGILAVRGVRRYKGGTVEGRGFEPELESASADGRGFNAYLRGAVVMAIPDRNYSVLLLGAGFSRPADLPLMREFMGEAERLLAAYPKGVNPMYSAFSTLLEFRAECRNSSWFFDRDWDNIEEIYTQADLLRLSEVAPATPTDGPSAQSRCQDIARAIWDVYRRHAGYRVNLPDLLNQAWNRGMQPAIITTNYDAVCETSIKQNPDTDEWVYFYPGFDLPWSESQFVKQQVGTTLTSGLAQKPHNLRAVPIIKLHGSVNWFQSSDLTRTIATTVLGVPYDTTDDVLCVEGFRIKSVEVRCFEDKPATPAIIPPMLGKMSASPTIAAQWAAAIEVLTHAKVVKVIGYSFPQTDAFMTRLLSAGIAGNQVLREFGIYNPSCDTPAWRNRIEEFFSRSVVQNGKVHFENKKTEELFTKVAQPRSR